MPANSDRPQPDHAGPTREALLAALAAAFPGRDTAELLAQLDRYGGAPHEREVARVQAAVVALCGGSEAELIRLVDCARVDYRDVLMWHSMGPLSPDEGERQQQAVRDMLKRWGRPPPER